MLILTYSENIYTIAEVMKNDFVLMRSPKQILDTLAAILADVGGEEFYRSASQQMQKHRESLSSMFFVLAMRKATNLDWFFCQGEQQFPDFSMIAFGGKLDAEDMPEIFGEQCEHVEIPPDCAAPIEALQIIQNKFEKNYDNPDKINLVIFVNNERSSEWVPFLGKYLNRKEYFKSVWTVHLLFSSPDQIKKAIVHRLRPEPVKWLDVSMTETQLFTETFRADIFDPFADAGKNYYIIKETIRVAIKKKAIRARIIALKDKDLPS